MGNIIRWIKQYKKEESILKTKYQLHKPVMNTVGIQLQMKPIFISNSYKECGTLEIKFKKQINPEEIEFDELQPIRLSRCNAKRIWACEKRWKNSMIVFCLINTNESWETTMEYENVPMFTGTKHLKFNRRISIDVSITEMQHDVYYQDTKQLCDDESTFVEKRRRIVFRKMIRKVQKRNVDNFSIKSFEDVPNIAIIGSGGGIRAVIGMSSAMTILQEHHITDYAMYTAGLSGSAWYLLTLYANDDFNSHSVNDRIRKNLHKFNGTKTVILKTILTNLGKAIFFSCGFNASFTNAFGEMVATILLEGKFENKLSDRTKILQHGNFPLPLIAALHVRDKTTRFDHNEWIELSPYQVFIPRYGAAINMKQFGKSFYGGFCTDQNDEKPISFLQGMCGSAYTMFRDLRPSGRRGYKSLSCIKKVIWYLFNLFDSVFVAKVPNILRGITSFDPLPLDKEDCRQVRCLSPLEIIFHVVNPVVRSIVDLVDVNARKMLIVDAGYAFNSPYPSILRPSRKIDLILSFDFSERDADKKDPFTDLIEAEKWAKKRGLKFPTIKAKLKTIEEERGQGQYKELYIFEDEGTPTIMHFVMVNNSFRTIGCQICNDFNIFPSYATMRFKYTRPAFNKLHYLVRHNVKINVSMINKCIQTAIYKKQRMTANKK